MNTRRLLLSVFATALGVLTLAVGPALAAREYVQSVSLGTDVNQTKVAEKDEEEADGEPVTVSEVEENICTVASGNTCGLGEAGSGKGGFGVPRGVAVNDSTGLVEGAGDLYVVDGEIYGGDPAKNNRVERFSSTGAYLGQFNGSGTFEVEGKEEKGAAAPTGRFSEPRYVAVDNSGSALDPSAGDVYVVDRGHHVVDKFSATGEYLAQLTETTGGTLFGTLSGVTVDPSGNLWVYDETKGEKGKIDEFSDTGGFVQSFATGASVPDRGGPARGGLAVDSKDVYVGEENWVGKFEVATGKEVVRFVPEQAHAFAGGGVEALALDPFNDDLLMDDNESSCSCDEDEVLIDEPGGEPYVQSDGYTYATPLGTLPTEPSLKGSVGIAVNRESTVYLSEGPSEGRQADEVKVFEDILLPAVSLEKAAVAETEVTLHASVNPEGEAATECQFEYVSEEAFDEARAVEVEARGLAAKARMFAGEARERATEASARAKQFQAEGRKERAVEEEEEAKREVEQAKAEAATAKAEDASSLEQKAGWVKAAAAECEPGAASIAGSSPVAVHADVAGLTRDAAYHFRLTARTKAVRVREGTFFTSTRPPVEGETVSGVNSAEATVSAEIDAEGLPTSYRVEYGTSENYGSSTHEASVSAAKSAVGVTVHLEGLQAGTKYHARLVAANELGATQSSDVTFTTSASVAVTRLILPDNRAYELVSAPEDTEIHAPFNKGSPNEAGEFPISPGGRLRAAADGDAVAYVGDPPASGVTGAGHIGGGFGDDYVATRGPEGWESSDIAFPEIASAAVNGEYEDFSADLSVSIATVNYPITAEPEPPAGCDSPPNYRSTVYSHTDSGVHALITNNQPSGQCFAFGNAGISANDSHILLYSPYAYTGQAKEGAEFSEDNLYDSVDGTLHQVNVLPSGEPEQHPHATFGGSGSTFIGDVSADGSRVFWTDLNTEVTPEDPTGKTRLFVREDDAQPQSPLSKGECTVAGDACTVQVDAAQGGSGAGGGGRFRAASGDGSEVFFTDESQLTKESSAAPGEPDLYEYEVNGETGKPGTLVDLTVPKAGHADVQSVIGASEDGSYVYFVADGVLTQGPNAEGREPVAGQPNLYLSHDGETTFVVTEPGVLEGEAEVAPSGHAVAFRSDGSFTGYVSQGHSEMFVYEADGAHIFCPSCGGTPGGSAYVGSSGNPSFELRWINEAGTQVYFMTSQPLVPQDTDDQQEVYEWESDGSGGCLQATGCVAPLSDVESPHAAFFIDASANGEDVFFTQRASLVPKAVDETVKLYDARVDGGFPEAALSCTGTGCQGVPPAPPIFSTPASVTFAGVGNFETAVPGKTVTQKRKTAAQVRAGKLAKALKGCRREAGKKRAVCERRARRQYGPVTKRGKR
jgi:hypothetical protein